MAKNSPCLGCGSRQANGRAAGVGRRGLVKGGAALFVSLAAWLAGLGRGTVFAETDTVAVRVFTADHGKPLPGVVVHFYKGGKGKCVCTFTRGPSVCNVDANETATTDKSGFVRVKTLEHKTLYIACVNDKCELKAGVQGPCTANSDCTYVAGQCTSQFTTNAKGGLAEVQEIAVPVPKK